MVTNVTALCKLSDPTWTNTCVAEVVYRLVNMSSFGSTKSASELEIADGDGWWGWKMLIYISLHEGQCSLTRDV